MKIEFDRISLCFFSSSQTPATWTDSFRNIMGSAMVYLPKQTAEVFTLDWSFATVHLTSSTLRTVIAMNK